MLVVIGLALDCLGVVIVLLHTLYDTGIDAAVEIMKKFDNEKEQSLITKFVNGEKLSPVEKERLIDLVKENVTLKTLSYVVQLWLWINRKIFQFTPWIEEKPRSVNRYLWNICGLISILMGFIFQLIGASKR